MPTVPVIERTVESAPLGSVSLPDAPQNQTANVALKMMAEERQKVDQLAVLDADNQIAEFQTQLQTDLLSRQGKNAFGNLDEAKAQWGKFQASLLPKYTNERQRMAVEGRLTERWSQLNGVLQHDLAGKRLAFDNQTVKSWIANEQAQVAQQYQDVASVEGSLARQRAVMTDAARRNGLDPETLTAAIAQNTSDTHQTVIEQFMLHGQGQQAKAYLHALPPGSLTPDAQRRLLPEVEKSSINNLADQTVSKILPLVTPHDPTTPMYETDVMAALKQQTDDADVWAAAKPIVAQFVQDFNAKGQQIVKDRNQAVYKAAVAGMPVEAIRNLPEYRLMDGVQQKDFETYMTRKEGKPEEQVLRYMELLSDKKLLNDTNLDEELTAKRLDQSQAVGLANIKENNDPMKSNEGKTAKESIQRAIRQLQFSTNKNDNNREGTRRLQLLQQYINNHWTDPEYDPITFTEKLLQPAKDAFIRRLIDQVVGPGKRLIVDRYESPEARMEQLRQEAGVPQKQTTIPSSVTPIEPGNIDIFNRPVLKNKDGSISTTRSMSFEENGQEVLIPTVVDGKSLTQKEAVAHYHQTGEHLGKFKNAQEADQYATELHNQQAKSVTPSKPTVYEVGKRYINKQGVTATYLGDGKWRVE